jgi:hypothetical protein
MNQIKVIFIALSVVILMNCQAQQLIPKKCYLHMTGTIDKEFRIEMNLVKINDTLYGDYFFLLNGKVPAGKTYYDGSMVSMTGKVNPNGTFIIRENQAEQGAVFTGHFLNGSAISGTWESSNGEIKAPFVVNENYPSGSVPLNVYYLKGSTPLVKKPKSPRAALEYSMLLPAESANPVFSDSLKKLVLQKFAGRPVKMGDPDRILLGMQQVYFENYISSNEAIYNRIQGMSFNWESVKTMNILLNGNNLLSFYIESYAFTGGAHGLQSRDYILTDLETGKLIGLGDLFQGDYEAALTTILTNKIRLVSNIPDEQKLSASGYFVDEVKPSSNFYITRNGIGFFYNHYEIAPYSNGPTDLFIPYGEIRKLLKPDGFLKGLVD